MKKTYLLATIAFIIALSSCGKNESGPGADYGLSKKNNVVWWQLADITNLIPYVTHDEAAPYVYQTIWEPLNNTNPRTQELIPWIASLPELSPDHKVYTYTLRTDVTYSDGKPLTGDDLIYSFKTVMNPNILDASPLRNYINAVDSVGFVNGDKFKVAFYLKEPYFMMDRVLGGGYVLILPKHIFDPENLSDKIQWADLKKGTATGGPIKEYAEKFETIAKDRSGKYYIGSGPYQFKDWKTNDYVSVGLRKTYWSSALPWGEAYPEEIIYKTISDPFAAVTALKGKNVDYMDRVLPASSWIDLKQPYIKKDTFYYNSYEYIAWNAERPIFRDKKVRLALSHLVNRDQLISTVLKGLCQKITSPIIFTQPNHVSMPEIKYDVETAKALLKEAGWEDTDGDGILDKTINGKKIPFKFSFSMNSGNERRKSTLLVVSEQLRKVGIQADVQPIEWSVFLENLHSHNFDASMLGLSGNAAEDDPYQNFHSSQSKNKGSNTFSFVNAEADKLMEDNRVEFDINKRKEMMKRFCEIVYDEQPITLLWALPQMMARVDRFDNVELVRQRPCVAIPFWVVRGSGVQAKPGAISTVGTTKQTVN